MNSPCSPWLYGGSRAIVLNRPCIMAPLVAMGRFKSNWKRPRTLPVGEVAPITCFPELMCKIVSSHLNRINEGNKELLVYLKKRWINSLCVWNKWYSEDGKHVVNHWCSLKRSVNNWAGRRAATQRQAKHHAHRMCCVKMRGLLVLQFKKGNGCCL